MYIQVSKVNVEFSMERYAVALLCFVVMSLVIPLDKL